MPHELNSNEDPPSFETYSTVHAKYPLSLDLCNGYVSGAAQTCVSRLSTIGNSLAGVLCKSTGIIDVARRCVVQLQESPMAGAGVVFVFLSPRDRQ